MPEIPECLNRRYRALDELIQQLSALRVQGSHGECIDKHNANDPGIKLMCDFWNILKEDPNCDLSQAVKQRMGVDTTSSGFQPQKVTCYMSRNRSPGAAGRGCGGGRDGSGRNFSGRAGSGRDGSGRAGSGRDDSSRGSSGRDVNRRIANDHRKNITRIRDICCESQGLPSDDATCQPNCSEGRDVIPDMPLTKALCNLKEAASLDKKCNVRVMELMETQKDLQAQIQNLEKREREGVQMLKEADYMWTCMEEQYKIRIEQSMERQKELLKQLKEVEKSNNKWRKNKKDLEDQIKSLSKCREEITEKISVKNNDIKCIELEIIDFNKRIGNNKRTIDGFAQNQTKKKTISDKKIASYNKEINNIKVNLAEVKKRKKEKEAEGKKYVKEAREDLQKLCRTLLQKKMENEDLIAQKEGLYQEIDLLKQTCDQCKDKCSAKKNYIEEEIKKIDKNIEEYRYQCVQCHQCTDTQDARRLCSDCPKCKETRECTTEGDHCTRDPTYDCVCISTKEKFLNNVFENMYTVLERQSKTKPGKVLSDAIVRCLKNSRNGKLNCETRRQVRDFVLNTVKKNLNLTIVGGAVKTRCEMDADTYKQLMNCLKHVKPEKAPKEDKGTTAKKEACLRWGGPSECNCPGGTKYCACTRRAPPPPTEPKSCPPVLENDEEPYPSTVVLCPHKESISCGPECAMTAVPSTGGVSASLNLKPNKNCATSACPFTKNMRAAQCVLGPESLNSIPKTFMSSSAFASVHPKIPEKPSCKCEGLASHACTCPRDHARPRNRLIEEVMGGYYEITPIEKVTTAEQCDETNLGGNINHKCTCNAKFNAFKDGGSQICECSSDVLLIEGTDALIDMMRKKNLTHMCEITLDKNDASRTVKLVPKQGVSAIHKQSDTRVHVILPPKYLRFDEECETESCLSRPNSTGSENIYERRVSQQNFAKNRRIPNVKNETQDLLRHLSTSDKNDISCGLDVKWMTIDSLIKLMSSQNDTNKHQSNIVATHSDKNEKKSLRKLKKRLETVNTNSAQLFLNKLHPSITMETRNNYHFNCFNANGEYKRNDMSLKVHNQCYPGNLNLLQDDESKCYVRMKEPTREIKRWKYFIQALTSSKYQNTLSNLPTAKANIIPNRTSQIKYNNKMHNNKRNVNYRSQVKNKKMPDIGLDKTFRTLARKHTFGHYPVIIISDYSKRKNR